MSGFEKKNPGHSEKKIMSGLKKVMSGLGEKNDGHAATGLRLEIQKLKNTIATRRKENPHNPELLLLNKLCNQKKKELIIDYKKQNSALLHKHAHEIKVTPFNATMNTAWQLLHDYKSNEAAGKSQLPSQMRTNKSIDKRLWWPDHIQRDRDPALGQQRYHQCRYALGHDLLALGLKSYWGVSICTFKFLPFPHV